MPPAMWLAGWRGAVSSYRQCNLWSGRPVLLHQLHDFPRLQGTVSNAEFIHLAAEAIPSGTAGTQPASQPDGIADGGRVFREEYLCDLGPRGRGLSFTFKPAVN